MTDLDSQISHIKAKYLHNVLMKIKTTQATQILRCNIQFIHYI